MSDKNLANDEVVRRLSVSFEADKLPPASSDEFMAAVRDKAMSVFMFRLAVVLGVLVVVGIGVVGYQIAVSQHDVSQIQSTDDQPVSSVRGVAPR
ncbi:MAG: hypothetical protein ACIARQ_07760 [Phycisphaerales bacterium JB061]